MATLKKDRKEKVRMFTSLPSYARTSFGISFSISFILLFASAVSFYLIQPEIPFFYSLPRSNQQLANKLWIFFFPALSWIISFGHLSIIKVNPHLKSVIAKLFSWSTVMIQVILLIIFLRILIVI